MEANEAEETLCDGTGCQNKAKGQLQVMLIIPFWRRPGPPLRTPLFERGGKYNYCAEHEAAARESMKTLKVSRF